MLIGLPLPRQSLALLSPCLVAYLCKATVHAVLCSSQHTENFFQTVADCVPMLQVLQKLADMQTVDYGFEVYQLPMHCDAPVTVLSCGSSLLRGSTAVQIPLQPTAEFGEHQHSQHKCGGNCKHDVARCGCRHSAAGGAACGLPGSDSCKSFSGPGKETQVLAPRRSE